MENSVKKSNEHSGEEDKERDIQENNNGHMCLAITNCNAETHAKLDEIITHYEGTLNQKVSHLLGILFMISFYWRTFYDFLLGVNYTLFLGTLK